MGIGQIRPPLAVILAARDEQLKREREVDRAVLEGLIQTSIHTRSTIGELSRLLGRRRLAVAARREIRTAWQVQHAQ